VGGSADPEVERAASDAFADVDTLGRSSAAHDLGAALTGGAGGAGEEDAGAGVDVGSLGVASVEIGSAGSETMGSATLADADTAAALACFARS
jgi:hypothetical protein